MSYVGFGDSDAHTTTSWTRTSWTHISTPESSVVTDVERRTATLRADIVFTTLDNFFTQLSTAASRDCDALLVRDVLPENYNSVEQRRGRLGMKFRLLYIACDRILFITIPTTRHEALHLILFQSIIKAAGSMDLDDELLPLGATRYNASTAAPALAGSYGEGDSALQPISVRPSDDDWPSVMIESGDFQNLPSMRAKAAFWFAASDHEVKIVLLAKVFSGSQTRRILLEHWQERPRHLQRQGATTTRVSEATAGLVPYCVQSINICLADGMEDNQAVRRNPASYTVVRGPLQLDFVKMFLRAPAGPHEYYLMIPDDKLQQWAARVWKGRHDE